MDIILLKVKNIFFSKILPNYLVFISAKKYLEFFAHISETYSWKSKGLSEKIIEK